ncbi:carboxypeptidase-like regulatory domain-containing protein [Lacinutrix jangbogonensis]|uniref:carboxypeptidase-like regulatory domain-containing protein n=1 Tax=Lacinutrix jangbogonensis TaxID=1469557 RepID=UPI00053EC9CC|nr:carboxypeptidase-like regulatory domain-containing protein [Lacinutrix jangbogonensis]
MKISLLIIILLFTSIHLTAQQKEITGTLLDEDHLPLPGVKIEVNGLETDGISDFDGKYAVVAKYNDVITFRYIDFHIEKTVTSKNEMSFTLIIPEEFQKVITSNCGFNRGRFAPQITYQYAIIKFR